jgi:phage shock protein PspC (stress-responsive transcriptional regulator)
MERLYRLKSDRMLGGVCAGLDEHLDVDPTVIRLVWAILSLLSLGTGIVVYILAWIIIPEKPDEPGVPAATNEVGRPD